MNNYEWDPSYWALSKVDERYEDGTPKLLHDIFSLKCYDCGRFSLGCKDHWFCGCCEDCKTMFEDADDAS